MHITINGKSGQYEASTLGGLITSILPNHKHVLAELNGVIVERGRWTETPVKDGDRLELVSFVAGG